MIKSYIKSELSSLTSRTLTADKCSIIRLFFLTTSAIKVDG